MRTRVWGTVLAGVSALTMGIAACVGDDPTSPASTAVPDSGGGSADTGGTTDTGSPVTDGGGTDSAVPVTCQPGDPQLFPAGQGPFCEGATLNHCAFGQHCCRDLSLNTSTCAASCPSDKVDVACYNAAECNPGGDLDGGMICCGAGTIALGVCSYAVTKDLQATRCSAACVMNGTEFRVCATQGECTTGTCTPTFALKPDGKATSKLQIAGCR